MRGLLANKFHVGGTGAHVFGGDVSALQSFDEASMSAEEFLAVFGFVVAEDDRLASTQGKSGKRILVGHAAREAQYIMHGFVRGGVVPEAGASGAGAEHGAVDGDDAVIVAFGFASDDDAFVAVDFKFGDVHVSCFPAAGFSICLRMVLWQVPLMKWG
jgi:hypothetical protein